VAWSFGHSQWILISHNCVPHLALLYCVQQPPATHLLLSESNIEKRWDGPAAFLFMAVSHGEGRSTL
jgi:hypothetical protein